MKGVCARSAVVGLTSFAPRGSFPPRGAPLAPSRVTNTDIQPSFHCADTLNIGASPKALLCTDCIAVAVDTFGRSSGGLCITVRYALRHMLSAVRGSVALEREERPVYVGRTQPIVRCLRIQTHSMWTTDSLARPGLAQAIRTTGCPACVCAFAERHIRPRILRRKSAVSR